MLSQFDAILFDMDGVIVDSETLWPIKQPNMIKKYYPDFPIKECRNFMGQSAKGVFDILQSYSPEISEYEFMKRTDLFAQTEIYPHAKIFTETLQFIQQVATTHKTAIASSSLKPWVDIVVQTHTLGEYFDTLVSSDQVGGASKPNPAVFLEAAKRLEVHPKKCLVIEDSAHGVRAGKNAGMTVFAFRSHSNQDQDLSVADFEGTAFKNLF